MIEPRHPGTVLKEDYMDPSGLSARRLAKGLKIHVSRISALVRGDRDMTPDTAILIEGYFGRSAEFWMDLNRDYVLDKSRKAAHARFKARATRPSRSA